MGKVALILSDLLQRVGLQWLIAEYFPDTEVVILNAADLTCSIEDDYVYITDTLNYVSYSDFFSRQNGKCGVVVSGNHQMSALANSPRFINTSNALEQVVDDVNLLLINSDEGKQRDSSGGGNELSSREIQVLTLVVSGAINKEIACQLNISLNTVLTHRKNITAKLGIKTVSGLTLYALMHGYIQG